MGKTRSMTTRWRLSLRTDRFACLLPAMGDAGPPTSRHPRLSPQYIRASPSSVFVATTSSGIPSQDAAVSVTTNGKDENITESRFRAHFQPGLLLSNHSRCPHN